MKGINFISKNGNKYFYDDLTGLIHYGEFDEKLEKYERHSKDIRITKKEDVLENIYQIKEYIYGNANGFRQLLIETTSQCNFRCKYCVYSENYKFTKGYTNKYMEFNIAKKAIDYYFENFSGINYRNPTRVPIIGFYGGEPLMNFKLIRKCVEYINLNYNNYDEIQYNITTNGLLLTEETIDFLVENNFAIIVSMDGYKENHDRNRVKINGTGTFDEVLTNIKILKNKYPDYLKLGISACYDIKSDLNKYVEFFDKEKLFVAKLSPIDPNNSTYYDRFSDEEKMIFRRRQEGLREEFLNQALEGKVCKESFLYTIIGIDYSEFAIHQVLNEIRPSFFPFTSCCVPGEKIYVTVDGNYHVCEKINTNFPIGNVSEGIIWSRVLTMITEYKKNICNNCKTCNVTRFCSLCFQHCCTDKIFKKPKDICNIMEKHIEYMLKQYIDVLEAKPDLFDHITIDYYKTIYEMVGMDFEQIF